VTLKINEEQGGAYIAGLSYDPTQKAWTIKKTNPAALLAVNYPNTQYYINAKYEPFFNSKGGSGERMVSVSIDTYRETPGKRPNGVTYKSGPVATIDSVLRGGLDLMDRLGGDVQNALGVGANGYPLVATAMRNYRDNIVYGGQNLYNQYTTAQNNEKINKEIIIPSNQQLSQNNDDYQRAINVISGTKGGDYTQVRDALRNSAKLSKDAKAALENYFKAFYRTEKLQTWSTSLGAKPLYGAFDPKYYKQTYPEVAEQWKSAVANDDLDITERYGENGYYLQHYTNQGKPAGYRGNAPEVAEQSRAYVEKKPTDQDIQAVRELQLGVDANTQTQRLLNIPEIAAEWQKAKRDDPYWRQLAKEKYLNVDKPDEFVALFRLSKRPEDKQVSLNYNINAGYGITELEDAINQAVGEKASVDVKRFGALAQDVLKETISEMKQAKAKEEMLGLLGGFSGFGEIMNINNELSNAILGDSGIGGLLSFTSGGKAEESLEKSLQNITGVRNNTTYNWQQWFDNELKTRYQKDLELGYTTKEAQEQVKIQGEFARKFIDDYLIPRFNTARSMDEFVEYIDIRQEEQNPFQTQDMVNAVNLVADLRAKQYLDQIKTIGDQYFDSEFYFNPVGNKAREAGYATQAATVARDWEAAKKGDPYWAQQAYRFGIDLNDKDAFARIHFQVKGQGQGFDAAKDILTAGGVQDEIYNNILPALKEEALKQGSIFGQFVTPEEFADEMLRGLDPNDKTTWQEVLQRYGLTDFKGTVDELKQYVTEALRTGSAQEIREQIKYLNEKRQKPTQQVLGLTYIERPEDYKDEMAKPQTELYKVFQGVGYQGTEDEFYQNFFPDLDRSEQTILTKAGSNEALKTYGLDLSDPFASLGTIESFFDEQDTKTEDKTKKSSSFFRLGLGEDEEKPEYKTKTGTQILGEFTSMFKGL
jgi:hypothetical protein